MSNYKHIAIPNKKKFEGDLYFFDKKIFNDELLDKNKQIIDQIKNLHHNEYVEFKKSSQYFVVSYDKNKSTKILKTYESYREKGRFGAFNEFFINKNNKNKVSELFVSTTDPIIYKIDDEHRRQYPIAKEEYEKLDQNNFKEILNKASLKDPINFRFKKDRTLNQNGIINITSGKLIIYSKDLSSIVFDVPIGKHQVYEVYDKTFDTNISDEIKGREYQNKNIALFTKYGSDETIARKHGYDPDYYDDVIRVHTEAPNIHFLYVNFEKGN